MAALDPSERVGRKGDPNNIPETTLLLLINRTRLFVLLPSLHLGRFEIQMLPILHRTGTCRWPFKHLQRLLWSAKGGQWMISKMPLWNWQEGKQAGKGATIQWENCICRRLWVPRGRVFPYLNNHGWPGRGHDPCCGCIHPSKPAERVQSALAVTSALVTEGDMTVCWKHGYWSVWEVVLSVSYPVYFAYTFLFMHEIDMIKKFQYA